MLCSFYASLFNVFTQFTTHTNTQEDANTEIGYLLVTVVAY